MIQLSHMFSWAQSITARLGYGEGASESRPLHSHLMFSAARPRREKVQDSGVLVMAGGTCPGMEASLAIPPVRLGVRLRWHSLTRAHVVGTGYCQEPLSRYTSETQASKYDDTALHIISRIACSTHTRRTRSVSASEYIARPSFSEKPSSAITDSSCESQQDFSCSTAAISSRI